MHLLSFLLFSFLLCSASANEPAVDKTDFTTPENVTVNTETLEEITESTQSPLPSSSTAAVSSSTSSTTSKLSTSIDQEFSTTTVETCHLEKCATTMMNNTERMMEKLQKALGMVFYFQFHTSRSLLKNCVQFPTVIDSDCY